jgi:hypothetical protein
MSSLQYYHILRTHSLQEYGVLQPATGEGLRQPDQTCLAHPDSKPNSSQETAQSRSRSQKYQKNEPDILNVFIDHSLVRHVIVITWKKI